MAMTKEAKKAIAAAISTLALGGGFAVLFYKALQEGSVATFEGASYSGGALVTAVGAVASLAATFYYGCCQGQANVAHDAYQQMEQG